MTRMTTRNAFLIIIISLIAGGLWFLIYHQIIVIRSPFKETTVLASNLTTTKKQSTLLFWANNSWKSETREILWSHKKSSNLISLIDAWLAFLDEEKIMPYKVTLTSVLLCSKEQELFLSFDRNPFHPQASTFTKWMWVESLLKTIRNNGLALQSIRFLVEHQPLEDRHLDFSFSWPAQGFLVDQN